MKTSVLLKPAMCILFSAFYLFTTVSNCIQAQGIMDKIDNAELIENMLNLTIVGNGYSDQTFVIFVPGSTPGFDSEYDAYKLMGIYEAPQLYSIIPCCNLSVNALPDIYTNHLVQLGFQVGNNTSYTISAEGLYTFGADTNVVLVDTKDNQMIELKSDSVYTFTGETTDDETRFQIYINYPMKLDLNVYLEGPFNSTDMNTDLNSEGIVPISQPFNGPPWNYGGTESVGSLPNADVVDWLLVEIRNATDASLANSSTMVEQQACFLLKDGSVTGLDGTSLPEFTQTIFDDAFVVVWHRNHLGIIAANPLVRVGGMYAYDFTSFASQAYGGSAALKDIGGGAYGLFGGDGNADGTIDNDDKISIWWLIAGKRGYESADYNLDGQANNKDKNDIWNENLTESSQIP